MSYLKTRHIEKISRRFTGRVALIALMALGLAIPSIVPALGQTQGPKRTEKLVDRAERVVRAVGEAEAQVRRTIEIYNSIMQGRADDRRKSFENLQKEINNTQKKREDVRKRFDEMDEEAGLVFATWHTELEAITSPQVRDLSRTRLMDTREKYNSILIASTEAGSEVDTLFATLHDHVMFLGYDLNESGIASLSEEAEKLNEQATSLLAGIDETVLKLNEYIQATRTQ